MSISQKTSRSASPGFTTIELMVTVGIIVVIAGIALPSIMHAWHSYQLSGTAADVAGLLKLTRFEAIRSNTVVRCLFQQQANNWWLLGVDRNNNGVIESTEPQILLSGSIQLLPPGIAPPPISMGFPGAQTPYGPGGPGFVAFDPRGGVNFAGGPQVVHVLYIGDLIRGRGRRGFRAVTVLPLGNTRTWSAGLFGPWHSPIY